MAKSKKVVDGKKLKKLAKQFKFAEIIEYKNNNNLNWADVTGQLPQIACYMLYCERHIGDTATRPEIESGVVKFAPHCRLGTIHSYFSWLVRPDSLGRAKKCDKPYQLIELTKGQYTMCRRNSIIDKIGVRCHAGKAPKPSDYENWAAIINASAAQVHTGKVKPIKAKKKADKKADN